MAGPRREPSSPTCSQPRSSLSLSCRRAPVVAAAARKAADGSAERVVNDHLDERRLDGLVAIGCDEISYRRGQRYLTSVVDHHAGAIVWCSPGRKAQTLQRFFTELGPERTKTIRAVSIDMSGGYA